MISDCELQIANWELQISDCELGITDFGLRIADCGLGIANWKKEKRLSRFSLRLTRQTACGLVRLPPKS